MPPVIDPIVAAVAGALVTVVGLFYRHLLQEKAKCEADALFWREQALRGTGLSEIATEQAERNGAPPKRRSR